MSNVMNTPAEVIEAEYPVKIACQKLRRGSGGRGAHRGGDGLHREYLITEDDISLTSMFERARIPPYGLQGGQAGSAFQVNIITTAGETYQLPGKANVTLNRGDLVILE
ncbi:MAG: hydantoinase B/oxoprolinase family protein, partial [Alphaproteobacteria bacterium]|nr:hydantoinase B/oxoprolinase family protein [Alphaproteobacteria bacterium]